MGVRHAFTLAALLATSCGDSGPEKASPPALAPAPEPVPAAPAPAAIEDRTPASEAPFSSESAQGAANVLQTYYALIERGQYDEAFRLREPGKRGPTLEQFIASFSHYAEHHATVGAPSQIAAASGSSYVEVPVQLYGRMKSGKPFGTVGTVTLRRKGSKDWRIYTSG